MSELLDKWLDHYDPIHRGWTPRGIANGVCATRGFAFPRVAGGYNLYRSFADSQQIDLSTPAGAAGAGAAQIETFPWRSAGGSAGYVFALRSIGGGGVESAEGVASRVIQLDSAGVPDPLIPNGVRGLALAVISGGRFELSWSHLARREETAPGRFSVYSDEGSGTVDFESPIGSVPYVPRRSQYTFLTPAYSHGQQRRFAVRAMADSGATDGSIDTVSGVADAVGPPVHPAVLVEIVEAD